MEVEPRLREYNHSSTSQKRRFNKTQNKNGVLTPLGNGHAVICGGY